MNPKYLLKFLPVLAVIFFSLADKVVASTLFESRDVLSANQALGRFMWLKKCYSGLLLEVADQMFDPTNPTPNDVKLDQLQSALLYTNGKLRQDAKYFTFGNSEYLNPKNWFAGTKESDICYTIPSDYGISAMLVASRASTAYCEIKAQDSRYEYIKSVAISDLNNVSGASEYSNFVGQAVALYREKQYPLTLTPGFVGDEPFPEFWHVFVDWNRDGDFLDESESYAVGSSDQAKTVTLSIPKFAKPGITKMRITMDYFGGHWRACEGINSGEVEDYLMNIK